MFIRVMGAKRRVGAVPVHLNVYDLTPINGYAYWLGLGVYHSGVQGTGSLSLWKTLSRVDLPLKNTLNLRMRLWILLVI
jgi:hypothetical protein